MSRRTLGGWDHCPNRQTVAWLDIDTWETFSATCGSLKCPYCIEVRVWKTAQAMAVSRPSRYAVLTLLHPTWEQNRDSFQAFFRILDNKGYKLRAWYTIERNKADGMYHANLYWHSPGDVPKELLVEAAEKVGWGRIVYVQRYNPTNADQYAMKEASTYAMKEAQSSTSTRSRSISSAQAEFLKNNGGRLLNARRGQNSPWRAGVNGAQLPGWRDAWTVAKEARFGKQPERNTLLVNGRKEPAFSRDTDGNGASCVIEYLSNYRQTLSALTESTPGNGEQDAAAKQLTLL